MLITFLAPPYFWIRREHSFIRSIFSSRAGLSSALGILPWKYMTIFSTSVRMESCFLRLSGQRSCSTLLFSVFCAMLPDQHFQFLDFRFPLRHPLILENALLGLTDVGPERPDSRRRLVGGELVDAGIVEVGQLAVLFEEVSLFPDLLHIIHQIEDLETGLLTLLIILDEVQLRKELIRLGIHRPPFILQLLLVYAGRGIFYDFGQNF